MMAEDKNNPAPPAAPACLRDVEAWIFDLDNTLYSATIDLFSQIDERMRSYIAAFLGLPIDNAYALQKQYFREYGTSLRGETEVGPGSVVGPLTTLLDTRLGANVRVPHSVLQSGKAIRL